MAEETSVLKVGISGAGAKVGASEFKNAAEQIKKDAKAMLKEAKQSIKELYDEVFSFKGLIGALGIGAVLKDIVATNVEFQRLEANLKTVTGSAMGAKAAFGELQKFAASTPFGLRNLTQAFTTLKLSGIDTSNRAMTAFGNIASSFGRDITDLASAMKSAMAGEMEALSSFGPKVVTQGNKYLVTFQGMRYEIEKNGKALEDFIINLGETKFAGGMENQMQTMAGVWSNIGDNFDRLKSQIGAGGLNDAIKELLDWLNNLSQGGDKTAKALGAALGDAVRSLTEALKFLVLNFEFFSDVLRTLAILAFVNTLISLGRTLWLVAKAWNGMSLAMAINPIGLIAVGVSILISYLYGLYQESQRAAAELQALKKETETMVETFKKADDSSLDNVLATSTALADEIERTAEALVTATGNTTELAKRMALLKEIESDSADKILTFIGTLGQEKSNQLMAQETRTVSTPADLKKQLKELKAQREIVQAEIDKTVAGAYTSRDILRGDNGIDSGEAMPGGGTRKIVGTQAIDVAGVRQAGKDFVTKLADADRLMQKIDETERKLAVKTGKISASEAKKATNELNNAIENMRAGIVGLEADAQLSALSLSSFIQLGDGPEAQKLLEFKKKYNQVTKDGTIPITAEETSRIKAATAAIIDNNRELSKRQAIATKRTSVAEDITRAQWDSLIDVSVPPGLQEIERQIVDIMISMKLTKEEANEFRDALTYIAGKQGEIRKREVGRDFAAQLDGLQMQLELTGATTVEIQKQTMLKALMLELQQKGISYTQEELQGWTDQIVKIAEAQQKIDRLSSIKSFVSENNDLMKSLADLSVQAIDQIADAWVEFTETGKFNFKEFASFVSKEITKIIIKFLIAKAIEESLSAFGKTSPMKGFNPVGVGVAHSGGAVASLGNASRSVSGSIFSSAPRYALGGIPGMKPGEVPIVAHREEAIVPLPSGKGIPVDLKGAAPQGGGGDMHLHLHGVKDFDSFKRNAGAATAEMHRMMIVRERRDGTKKG